jgi:hypothetical protein
LTNINSTTQTAVCNTCGPVKVYPRNDTKTQWRCSIETRNRSKVYKQAYRQAKKEQLNDSCEICGSKEKLCWDHSHQTGKFRGTLCSNCNSGIGMLMDDYNLVLKAYTYLKDKPNDKSGTLQAK